MSSPPPASSTATSDGTSPPAAAASTSQHETPPSNLTEATPDTSHHDHPTTTSAPSQTSALKTDTEEPRRCWICFADETEDTPETSAWKSPCVCALTAHEACLLDWVADLEAPGRSGRDRGPRRIECPQCKSEIRIARPHSTVVAAVRRAERFAADLTVPGIILALTGSLATGAWMHGLASVYAVFGPDDFLALLGLDTAAPGHARPGAALATALVPSALVASRTRAADSVLPMLPVLFFATQYPEPSNRRRPSASAWPPSPALAFVCLPYLRGVYNLLWESLVGARERQWIREVDPRAGRNGSPAPERGDNGGGEGGQGGEGRGGIAIDFGFDIRPQRAQQQEQRQPQAPAEQLPGDDHEEENGEDEDGGNGDDAEAPEADNGAANNGAANNGANLPDQAHQLVDTGGRIADAVMGALALPFVAAAAGELLRALLPTTWTMLPEGRRRATGLLQLRWGRSLLGGCLFVVVKDTLRLYARYRLAADHRKRSVVDYERKGRRR